MASKNIDIRELRERAGASSQVTKDDRAFMRKMKSRLPNLSSRHGLRPEADDGDTRPGGGYLHKLRND